MDKNSRDTKALLPKQEWFTRTQLIQRPTTSHQHDLSRHTGWWKPTGTPKSQEYHGFTSKAWLFETGDGFTNTIYRALKIGSWILDERSVWREARASLEWQIPRERFFRLWDWVRGGWIVCVHQSYFEVSGIFTSNETWDFVFAYFVLCYKKFLNDPRRFPLHDLYQNKRKWEGGSRRRQRSFQTALLSEALHIQWTSVSFPCHAPFSTFCSSISLQIVWVFGYEGDVGFGFCWIVLSRTIHERSHLVFPCTIFIKTRESQKPKVDEDNGVFKQLCSVKT